MSCRLLVVSLVTVAIAGCGGGAHSSAGSTSAGATTRQTSPRRTMTLTLFRVEDGQLRASAEQVPETTAVAKASLDALGLPASVAIVSGTARVGLARVTGQQAAEIVYTLTQYPTVRRVDVGGRSGLTRADFAAYLPPIFIATPAAGAAVHRVFEVAGTASVFEATLIVELRRNGKTVARQTAMASEGAPGRGAFRATLHGSPGRASVRAYSPSPKNGSPQHEVDVPVTILP